MPRKHIIAMVLASGALAGLLPTAAAAKDHYVIINGAGFFPQITYVEEGDTVYFQNDANFTHELAGMQGEQVLWAVKVDPASTASLTVTETSQATYNSLNVPLEPGQISLEDPPEAAQAD